MRVSKYSGLTLINEPGKVLHSAKSRHTNYYYYIYLVFSITRRLVVCTDRNCVQGHTGRMHKNLVPAELFRMGPCSGVNPPTFKIEKGPSAEL